MRRTTYTAAETDITVREAENDDALYRIRLPVSSTGEVRNENDEPFTEDRLRGFAEQIRAGDIGVFLDHGQAGITASRYGSAGKIGRWEEPAVDLDRESDEHLLYADAAVVDPDALDVDGSIGDVEDALRWLRVQAEVGIPIATSVGWNERTGGRDLPGDADLLEISVVGVGADPAASTTASAPTAVTRGFEAVSDATASETPDTRAFSFRGWDPSDSRSDADRVSAALETLVRFAERTRDRRPYYAQPKDARGTRWGGSDGHRAIEDVVDKLAFDSGTDAVGSRVSSIQDSDRRRRDVLERLETIEEGYDRFRRQKGLNKRRPKDGKGTVNEAIDEIRDVLEDDVEREPTFSFAQT